MQQEAVEEGVVIGGGCLVLCLSRLRKFKNKRRRSKAGVDIVKKAMGLQSDKLLQTQE